MCTSAAQTHDTEAADDHQKYPYRGRLPPHLPQMACAQSSHPAGPTEVTGWRLARSAAHALVLGLVTNKSLKSDMSTPIPPLGLIEGFYGTPWTFEQRLAQIDFLARSGCSITATRQRRCVSARSMDTRSPAGPDRAFGPGSRSVRQARHDVWCGAQPQRAVPVF